MRIERFEETKIVVVKIRLDLSPEEALSLENLLGKHSARSVLAHGLTENDDTILGNIHKLLSNSRRE